MISCEDAILLTRMLSMSLGELAEITLSDRDKYIWVEHALSPQKAVGAPIIDDERYFLEDPDFSKLPFVVNYKSKTVNDLHPRSSTFFFRDDKTKDICYLLTISINVNLVLPTYKILHSIVNGGQLKQTPDVTEISPANNPGLSLNDIIETTVKEGEARYGSPAGRMTIFEKRSLIREMNTRGVFLIKGSVPLVAKSIHCSEPTIYRYLKELENKGEK